VGWFLDDEGGLGDCELDEVERGKQENDDHWSGGRRSTVATMGATAWGPL